MNFDTLSGKKTSSLPNTATSTPQSKSDDPEEKLVIDLPQEQKEVEKPKNPDITEENKEKEESELLNPEPVKVEDNEKLISPIDNLELSEEKNIENSDLVTPLSLASEESEEDKGLNTPKTEDTEMPDIPSSTEFLKQLEEIPDPSNSTINQEKTAPAQATEINLPTPSEASNTNPSLDNNELITPISLEEETNAAKTQSNTLPQVNSPQESTLPTQPAPAVEVSEDVTEQPQQGSTKKGSGRVAKLLLILGPLFLAISLIISYLIISNKVPSQLESLPLF